MSPIGWKPEIRRIEQLIQEEEAKTEILKQRQVSFTPPSPVSWQPSAPPTNIVTKERPLIPAAPPSLPQAEPSAPLYVPPLISSTLPTSIVKPEQPVEKEEPVSVPALFTT